jgi:RNA polymerase sigma-70 factor (ECF subfamily)
MENADRIETEPGHHAKLPQTTEADSRRGRSSFAGPSPSREVRNPAAGSDGDSFGETAALIEKAQAGDRMALNRLLTQTRPRLLAIALRVVRDRDDAEDVVQESLLKVCRYLTRFEGRAAFSTWIHRIVVNTSLDRLRRVQGRHERPAANADDREDRRPDPVDSIDEETPERMLARAEAGAAVQLAIARMSPVHREALALRELDGESYQSIAAIARCPVGTVMSRLHHARRRLAAELAPAYAPAMYAA